jgi:hypothetical protein
MAFLCTEYVYIMKIMCSHVEQEDQHRQLLFEINSALGTKQLRLLHY